MVVDNFDLLHTSRRPTKTDAVLVVHADAVLTFPAAFECLKAITRWDAQVAETAGDLELTQLASRDRFYAPETLNALAVGKGFRIGATERQYHRTYSNVTR
jgi:hypothetical protein